MFFFDSANLAYFIGLGLAAGFLGGLIGIGGGFVLVPGLYYVFIHAGIAPGQEVPLALGTTMVGMLATSIGSARAQIARNAVRFDIAKLWSPWIVAGTVLGAASAISLDAAIVKICFAMYCFVAAWRMLMVKTKNSEGEDQVDTTKMQAPGVLFGWVCGLNGIGGAVMFVPFLVKRGLNARLAIATASAMQVPIAFVGTIAYLLLGWSSVTFPGTLGYVYVPALITISLASIATAPLGVKLAHAMPISKLKKIFGVVTALVGAKMAGFFALIPQIANVATDALKSMAA